MKSQVTFQKRSIRKLLRILSREQPEAQTTLEEEPFIYSKPLQDAYPKPLGSFTVLPCRIGRQDDGVQAAIQRLDDDGTVMGKLNNDTIEPSIAKLNSPIGHFVTLGFPECIPTRLEIVTLIVETGTLLDDVMEDDSNAAAKQDVGNALMGVKLPARMSPRKAAIQKWMAKTFLGVVNIYGKEGQVFLERCQSSLRDTWATETDVEIKATKFEDYLSQRIRNFSMPALWATTAFSIGVLLNPAEYKLIQPLTDIATRIIIQTNDYFSWDVERSREEGQTFNGIFCLMKEHHITEEHAKARLKSYIMQDEQAYVSMLDGFYKTHPNLPIHVRKYISACAFVVSGNHHWSSASPRYNASQTHEKKELCDQNAEIETKSSELGLEGVGTDNPSTAAPASNKSHPLTEIDEAILDSSALLAPPRYIQSLPSKNIRSKLVDAFNIWFQLPEDLVDTIKGIINDLHNATLMLDDIQDESILRRGSSAAHCIFGPAQCINSATYMVVQAAGRINAHHTESPQLMDIFLEGLRNLSVGQSWDINWKFNSYCPSIAEYMAMIDGKTGAMFRLLVNLMKSLSSSQTWPVADFDRLIQLLGRWYQVRDDYQNLKDPEYAEQKGFCEDLDEGKLSYPVVLTCNSDPAARTIILGIFRRKDNGTPLPRSVKMQILDLIQKSGALGKTWQLVQQLEKEVEDTLSALETVLGEQNPSLRLITKLLSDIPPP
ncbi:hypothetical protein VE03_07123 [Pseudogymnoascus sp. 23342-1-I1]|nr:hypothetical protein VE03_07123 [Pseudogymnoascus sp. 23342-1-I1]